MKEWAGKLSRIDAIMIIERATDQDDPHWEWTVEDWYDEETDTLPSIFHVMAALGISESEYILATGAQNLKWPDRQPDELTTLRARVQELEESHDDLNDVLQRIKSWCEAYPIDIFPEVKKEQWPAIHEALKPLGIPLDRIAASNMRHVVTQIAAMIPTPTRGQER